MRVAVIIVNYNVKFFVEQCIRSVERASKDFKVDVYVVDNHSTDGSLSYLRQRFPYVNFIENLDNEGFSKANNKAITQSKSDFVALVNPDTLIGESVFNDCISAMQTNSQVGGIGVKMHGADGKFAYESRRGFPSPLTSFYKISGLSSLFPYSHRFGKYNMRYLDKNKETSIDIISGAFMFIRRKALEEVGLLDEDFFMYGEDIDLSYRITKAGYVNRYLPSVILHYKGESTKTNSVRYVSVFYDAMVIFFKKHFSHIGLFFSFLIKTTIYLRATLALIPRLGKAILKLLGIRKSVRNLRFLVLGDENTLRQMKDLCKRNSLNEEHHYILANERTTPNGHLTQLDDLTSFTHVVYDLDAYSVQKVLELLSHKKTKSVLLGTYSTKSHVLILPERILK